jgi:hypothetical protein
MSPKGRKMTTAERDELLRIAVKEISDDNCDLGKLVKHFEAHGLSRDEMGSIGREAMRIVFERPSSVKS